mmetsp:Transcript_32448/g.71240  ORF Transcript_32448/g.71240 Transcript_32448/m.71240 type:complete len:329 (-) Transcript_32448:182-1168(-)
MSSSPEKKPSGSRPSSSRGRRGSSRRQRLNELNILNAGYCFVSTLLNVGVGLLGWFRLPSYAKQSGRFPTLISPAPWFITGIWIFIFVLQGLFTVFQMTTVLRARAQVQDGVKYYYGLASLFQVMFTLTYCTEMFWASCVFSFAVIIVLRLLIESQANAASDHSWAEFWVLKFPFRIHLAWMDFVAVLNINNILVYMNASTLVQLICGGISLAILIIVSVMELFKHKTPLFIIPITFCYAVGGAVYELFLPSTKHVTGTFKHSTLIYVKIASAAVCALLLILILLRWIMYLCRGEYKRETKEAKQEEDDEKLSEEGAYVNADQLPTVV